MVISNINTPVLIPRHTIIPSLNMHPMFSSSLCPDRSLQLRTQNSPSLKNATDPRLPRTNSPFSPGPFPRNVQPFLALSPLDARSFGGSNSACPHHAHVSSREDTAD